MNKVKSNELGRQGEDEALSYLIKKGYILVERNYRTRYGEIDLIMQKDQFLIFVEVKWRKNSDYGYPREFVDHRKQDKIRLAAEDYLLRHPDSAGQPRFDVVEGFYGEGVYEHIENAF